MHRHYSCRQYVRLIMTFTAGLLMLAVAASGQENSGNVFGKVVDKSGAALPGVTITLNGPGAPQTFVTDSQGQFRFLKRSPGKYTLRSELEGFSKVQRQVDVAVGSNTEVSLRLDPAVSETITVSAASPVIDRREVATGASIEQIELKEVPTARDPWVVLQSVPGVLVDRVNVGGNKSGQQSNFAGKGVDRTQTVWNVDGVTSTDMSGSGGASGFYFDFDSFQEFRVTTGSADPSVQTPGIQLNMVTKRGTNDLKGSGRYFWTGHQLQTDPKVPSEATSYLKVVNSINQISEVGAEAGGPIISDRLWMWGAYSRNPINVVVSSNSTALQKTDLWNYNGKFNGQISSRNAGFLGYVYSNKTVDHRGISPTRPVETSYNQSGPGWQYTLEDTHTFTPSLFLTARVGRIVNGYHLSPVGGRDTNMYYDKNGIPHGSYWPYDQSMPQKQANVEGSKFFNVANMNHELKFGFGYRRTPVTSASAAPGDQVVARLDFGEAEITRAARPNYGSNYKSVFAGDTITTGNLTLNAGFRYDIQRAKNNANSVEANGLFPDLLPAATYAGDTRALQWKSLSPRLAATYALGASKKTLLRGSYARYADQIAAGTVGANNPFYLIQYLYFYWNDINKDNRVQRGELTDFDVAINVDPKNPAAPFSVGRVDYGMKAPRTNEYILGFQREIGSAFAVGVDYTYRKRTNFVWTVYEKTRGARDYYTAADYGPSTRSTVNPQKGTLPNGDPYNITVYALKPGVPTPRWKVTTNRPDYDQSYNGIELTATKRMVNNWMVRGNVTFADWKQHIGPNGVPNGDPTPLLSNGCSTCVGTGLYAPTGSYLNAKWSGAFNGVYQFPHQITLGAALTGRQGYILPYYRRINARDGFGNKNILATDFNAFRLPNVYNLDFRIAKTFALIRGTGVELSADLFNTTNQQTIVTRDNRLRSLNGADLASGTNWIQEIQSPRIVRLGARITF
ncbi:MAG TPA: TonB-dependent receptor [Thermoanaerobaculia bacterium]|nr:TonB-dependent receptor [Thermoanaerobaculia bacterium]